MSSIHKFRKISVSILPKYPSFISFAVLVNEYKPAVKFQFKRTSKEAKFELYFYLRAQLCYEQNRCTELTGHHL